MPGGGTSAGPERGRTRDKAGSFSTGGDIRREGTNCMGTETGGLPLTVKGPIPYHLTVRQFDKMIGAGVFPDGVRVELLAGVLVRKMTKSDPHDFSVGELGSLLGRLLEPSWFAREEKSVVLGKQPEGRGKAAEFKEMAFYGPDDEVPVILEGQERGRIAVRDVLP